MNESAPSKFSNAGEIEQLNEYRQFNLLAVIAAVLGIASGSVLVSLFLIVVPLLAIFLGLCGLAAYRRRQELGGRFASWFAITIAVLFLCWSVSQFFVARCVLFSEAYSVADKYLKLVVAGEREIAHQAMMSITRRQAVGVSVDEAYAVDEQVRDAMESMFATEPLATLVTVGEDVQIELVQNSLLTHDLNNTIMQQIYRITPAGKDPIEAKVSILRNESDKIDRASWIVSDVEPNDQGPPGLIDWLSCRLTCWISSS